MKQNTYYPILVLFFLISSCNKEDLRRPAIPEDCLSGYTIPGMPTYDQEALERELSEPVSPLSFRSGKIVELPAGSVDGLATAIAEAGAGGMVRVKAGDHQESSTVTISQPVRIMGEPGARLIFDTQPTTVAGGVVPAIFLYNVSGVFIQGLEIVPASAPGGTGIVLENAPRTIFRNNVIKDHQFSILIEKSDRCRILKNTIVGSDAWQTGGLPAVHGIVNINGNFNWIAGNDISNTVFGIWACDKNGFSISNDTQGNLIGQILCNVPENAFPLPSGTLAGSETPGEGWMLQNNTSSGNFDAGYLVIDGANNNFLVGNKGNGNGTYDIELTSETDRFGPTIPGSSENWVVAFKNQTVKDCGDDNRVIGGELVDIETDPCY